MKIVLINFILFLALSTPIFCAVTEAIPSKLIGGDERNLAGLSYLDDVFNPVNVQISIGVIKDMIIDQHKNIKICIEREFKKEKEDIAQFKTILRTCVGDNYSIVLRFYDNINQYIRELTKDNIKSKVRTNYCVVNLVPCLEFFKIIGMFIDMDFDLLKSVDININELNRKIGERIVKNLMEITHNELGDYVNIRSYLLQERNYLNEYFSEKYTEYFNKYGNPDNTPPPPAL